MSGGPNSFIGKSLTIGKHSITIKEKIGEGGYAWVYRAADAQGAEYAFKYVNCLTRERYLQFKKEATVLQALPPFPHIVKLIDVSFDQNRFIINFLFELCPQTAMGILTKRSMTREEILIFFHAICSATSFLHSQQKPIIHRDLKPENLLVSEDGVPRLCDFGSATTTVYQITNPREINEASDDIEHNTTPNYRAPEMVDLYKHVPIGKPADIWALGCTLYKLAVKDDMYKPDERLPILQGKLKLPANMDKDFANIIKMCIQVDPKLRPTASRLTEIALMLRGDKDKIATLPKRAEESSFAQQGASGSGAAAQQEQSGGGWFSSMKDTVRSLVTTGADQWAIKATFGDGNPPVSKYVRRLVVGSIRRTNVDILHMVDFLLTQRPWQEDARIAAKSLYVILLMTQYQTDLTSLVPLTVKSDQVMAFFSQGRSDDSVKGAIAVINGIGLLLRSKLMFHAAHPEVAGNLAPIKGQASEQIAEDSLKYSKTVTEASKSLLKTAHDARDFSAIVMCQPAIEEALCCAKLIKKLAPNECESVLKEISTILDAAKGMPHLATAIDYPADINEPGEPLQRFVAVK